MFFPGCLETENIPKTVKMVNERRKQLVGGSRRRRRAVVDRDVAAELQSGSSAKSRGRSIARKWRTLRDKKRQS